MDDINLIEICLENKNIEDGLSEILGNLLRNGLWNILVGIVNDKYSYKIPSNEITDITYRKSIDSTGRGRIPDLIATLKGGWHFYAEVKNKKHTKADTSQIRRMHKLGTKNNDKYFSIYLTKDDDINKEALVKIRSKISNRRVNSSNFFWISWRDMVQALTAWEEKLNKNSKEFYICEEFRDYLEDLYVYVSETDWKEYKATNSIEKRNLIINEMTDLLVNIAGRKKINAGWYYGLEYYPMSINIRSEFFYSFAPLGNSKIEEPHFALEINMPNIKLSKRKTREIIKKIRSWYRKQKCPPIYQPFILELGEIPSVRNIKSLDAFLEDERDDFSVIFPIYVIDKDEEKIKDTINDIERLTKK